jgi:hypothetical protein
MAATMTSREILRWWKNTGTSVISKKNRKEKKPSNQYIRAFQNFSWGMVHLLLIFLDCYLLWKASSCPRNIQEGTWVENVRMLVSITGLPEDGWFSVIPEIIFLLGVELSENKKKL